MWVVHKSLFRDILVYQVVKDSLNSEVRIVRRFFQGRKPLCHSCLCSGCVQQTGMGSSFPLFGFPLAPVTAADLQSGGQWREVTSQLVRKWDGFVSSVLLWTSFESSQFNQLFFKHATHRPACSLAVPLDRTPLFRMTLEMWTQPFVLAAASPLYRASLAVCISIKQ